MRKPKRSSYQEQLEFYIQYARNITSLDQVPNNVAYWLIFEANPRDLDPRLISIIEKGLQDKADRATKELVEFQIKVTVG